MTFVSLRCIISIIVLSPLTNVGSMKELEKGEASVGNWYCGGSFMVRAGTNCSSYRGLLTG